MKTHLLLLTCLLLAGCQDQTANHREVLSKLDDLKSEVNKQAAHQPVRWATADKLKIMTAVYQFTREKTAELNKAEALPPEIEAKLKAYEALKAEQLKASIRTIPTRPILQPPGFEMPEPSGANKQNDILSQKLAEAKAPIAEIVDRRERQASQLREQYSAERLTAEYAKGRYDLVLDSREKALYHTNTEITDITDGIIALLNEKTKK